MQSEFAIRELEESEIEAVAGGNIITAVKVWMNSRTARATCGEGNVKSVSADGFECKSSE